MHGFDFLLFWKVISYFDTLTSLIVTGGGGLVFCKKNKIIKGNEGEHNIWGPRIEGGAALEVKRLDWHPLETLINKFGRDTGCNFWGGQSTITILVAPTYK